ILGEFKTGYYQPGSYTIQVSAGGCATKLFEATDLNSGETTTINATLICDETAITNETTSSWNVYFNAEAKNILVNYELANNGRLIIFNAYGQKTFDKLINGKGDINISTEKFLPGAYFVSFTGGNSILSEKIIIY
ncbi:MAG: T9SS type A sorting domain-containing protein, partial [Chitinophagales bacterium]